MCGDIQNSESGQLPLFYATLYAADTNRPTATSALLGTTSVPLPATAVPAADRLSLRAATFSLAVGPASAAGYYISFTVPGLPAVQSASFTVTIGPPAAFFVATQPAGATPGFPFAMQPSVGLADLGGNDAGDPNGISVSASPILMQQPVDEGGGSPTMIGAGAGVLVGNALAACGVAVPGATAGPTASPAAIAAAAAEAAFRCTFTDLGVMLAGTGFFLRFEQVLFSAPSSANFDDGDMPVASLSLSPADSATFAVAAGPPFKVQVATVPPATEVSEVALPPVQVRVEDRGGNLAATVAGDGSSTGGPLASLVSSAELASNPAGGAVVSGTIAAVVNGIATHVGLAIDRVQACVVSCT